MSFAKNKVLRGTLSFRMTLWYASVFSLTSLIILSIFYFRVKSVTMENTNEEMIEEYHDYCDLRQSEALDSIFAKLDEDEREEAAENVFLRLVAADGRIIRSSDMARFNGGVNVSTEALGAIRKGEEYVIETIRIPGYAYHLQTIYGTLDQDVIFNMGVSLEDNDELLRVFRNLIFLIMIPLIVAAAVLGWLLAHHALRGVEAVTETAIDISKGALERRVTVKQRYREIDRLAGTFNDMLDRIQALVKGMREMNDNVAHDLRSPLTRIRGFAEMSILGNQSIEKYQELAGSTIEECDKLIDIIDTVMDITETEAGVRQFKMETFDIIRLIHRACELFEPIAAEKAVRLVTVLPDSLTIRGSIGNMQRLITNLIENAIKYNRPGGSVTISVTRDRQHVNIQVADTGQGISNEDLPRIFERFYRCDRSRSQEGIGLGLSLARAIAEAFGGNIKVESKVDMGSSFVVELPV